MSKLPPIYFIRHGETDWNKQGLIQGSQGTDINEKGIQQAQDLARALAERNGELKSFDFYVSPQLRAQHTMRIIAEAQPRDWAKVQTDSRLRELEFGVWEGKPFWELKDWPMYPADPEALYQWRPEGGESYADGVMRVSEFLTTLVSPTLVVSHGAVGRALMGIITGLKPEQIVRLRTPQGCYCRLQDGQIDWFDANHDAA